MLSIGEVFSSDIAGMLKGSIPVEPFSMEDIQDARTALMFIQEFERPMRKELERMATSIVFNNFPIFLNNRDGVRVKARLVDHIIPSDPGENPEEPRRRPELLDEYRKRKIINMITQGAGIGTHGVHHLQDDFKRENPELVEAYDLFDRVNFKLMRAVPDEVLEAMGEGEAEEQFILGRVRLEHKNSRWTIHAEARTMPVLIHEIIKGMYELIAMNGLPRDRFIAEEVMEYTDTNRNEAMDLKYGERVYMMVRDYIRERFHDRTDRRPEVMEYYLQELYASEPTMMIGVVEDILRGKAPTPAMRSAIDHIYRELLADDAEL